MSAAVEIPQAPDAAAGTTHAPTDTTVDPKGGAESNSGPQTGATSAQPDPGDYEARLRAGGDFAVEENKKIASEKDRINGELSSLRKELGGVMDLVKQGHGSEIAGLANAALRLAQHPEYAEVVQAATTPTGPIPARTVAKADPDEDEYVDPLESKLEETRAEIARLEQLVSSKSHQATAREAEKSIEANFTKAFDGYDLLPEQREAMISGAQASLARLTEQQIDALDDRGWEVLLQSQIPAQDLREAANRNYARTRQERGELSTDGPSAVNPSQTEPTLSGTKYEVAQKALERLRSQGRA